MPKQSRARERGCAARRRLAIAGATALALVLGCAARAAATTYYVRASGSDARDGLSPDTAFASIRPAARLLRTPGDRLVVGPGTYHEGNIAPFGNGTPDAPIILLGDPTGALTNDRAGPVAILPTNTPSATTGLIVYGRSDIVIEGFTVIGASDAGIQVRARRRTGADSTRIAILNNNVSGGRKGIQITGIGEVEVSGNRLTGGSLVLTSGRTGRLQPLVSHNIIERSRFGMAVSGTLGGAITENQLRSNGKTLAIAASDGLRIVANTLAGPGRGGTIAGTDLEITDNVIQEGAIIVPTTSLVLRRNTFAGNLRIDGNAAQALVTENRFASLFMTGGSQLELEHNDGGSVQAQGTDAIVATDNRLVRSMKLLATSTVDARRNRAANLDARGAAVLVQANDLSGHAGIAAETATAAGNTAALLWIRRASVPGSPNQPGGARGPFRAEGNVVRGILSLGESANAVVVDNAVSGMLKARARDTLTVTRNRAAGIGCVLSAPDSQLNLTQNSSNQGTGAGLAVSGAGSAVVENNSAAGSAKSGLAVRRTNQLTIAGNDILSNASGGVSIRNPIAADCNRDLEVSIGDLMTAIGVALWLRPQHDCEAADLDGDGAVMIDELMVGVRAALAPPSAGGTVEIRANRIEGNGRFGVDVLATGPVLVMGNRVVRNGGAPLWIHGRGLPSQTEIVDNLLGLGGAEGLVLEGVGGARVRNNIVFSNHEAGILVRDASGVSIVNNLVYDNGKHGIAVGLGGTQPAVGALVMNNTLYRNHSWGIAIGGPGAAPTNTILRDNIVSGNQQGGIAAAPQSLAGLQIEFNLNNGGYSDGVPPGATDVAADPQFVAPAGADGVLGGDGYGDDDFHLAANSPAIDAGSASAAQLGITGSAVAGATVDAGIVDLGYHYGADDR